MSFHQYHRIFFNQSELYNLHDGKVISSLPTIHLNQCKISFHFLFKSQLTNTNLTNYKPQWLH